MRTSTPCTGGDHRPPQTGGSCACGMVTRIPASRPAARVDIRDVLARCLSDGLGDPLEPAAARAVDATASGLLRERADRVLAALTAAGLMLAPEAGERLPA